MPKSKVRKKTDYTINPASRTPVKVKAGPSSTIYVGVMLGLMVLGLAWLVVGGFMMFLPQMWVTLLGLALTAVVVVLVRLTVPGDLPPEPVVDPDGLTDGADRPVPAHV